MLFYAIVSFISSSSFVFSLGVFFFLQNVCYLNIDLRVNLWCYSNVFIKKMLEDILINSYVYPRTCFANSFLITT